VKSGHASHVQLSRQIKRSLMNGRTKSGTYKRPAKSKGIPALDVNSIMKVLPHRYPFLLVDRILSVVPFERAVGIKNVTVNEPFFQGHWPSMPVMPGVLILEAMAQVSSVIIFGDGSQPGKVAFFLGIDRARFRRTVVPGDQLVIEADMVHMRRNAGRVRAVAKIDDSIAAEAELLFGLMDGGEAVAEAEVGGSREAAE